MIRTPSQPSTCPLDPRSHECGRSAMPSRGTRSAAVFRCLSACLSTTVRRGVGMLLLAAGEQRIQERDRPVDQGARLGEHLTWGQPLVLRVAMFTSWGVGGQGRGRHGDPGGSPARATQRSAGPHCRDPGWEGGRRFKSLLAVPGLSVPTCWCRCSACGSSASDPAPCRPPRSPSPTFSPTRSRGSLLRDRHRGRADPGRSRGGRGAGHRDGRRGGPDRLAGLHRGEVDPSGTGTHR